MKMVGGAVLLALSVACSGSTGTASFVTWGEEYIEQEIPAVQDGQALVEDGWTIRYGKFLVNIGGVRIADGSAAPVVTETKTMLVDHKKPGRKALFSYELDAAAFSNVGYTISSVNANTDASLASEEDKAKMIAGGYSVYVEGTATKGTDSKAFAWGFTTNTLYANCKGEVGGIEREGVAIPSSGTDEVELTIHGDHFLYDDLQSPEAKLRFNAIAAADKDNDGKVTLEELAATKLIDIPAAEGPYGTGNAADVNDLRAFVTKLSQTVGHFRGEGECTSSSIK
ncbi:MAG: hypothetical protein KBF88_13985 [Polyangiaceae bacterium]|nr:hypothetical protein [Polyangiaceae bacterium]